ncbi:hypothetical protein H5410_038679 [Solanum commersonii]|uniref:DUF4283 domain-containing protein n=1 Tax=Solanum commersonii TaxID=4109 RepID=A0A9J5YC25_SOLCO|nr:hypothetical protein H5410_038679 [Solanum commersonii]
MGKRAQILTLKTAMAMESTTQVTGKQKKKGHQASLVQEANSEPNEAAESRIKEITYPRVMIQESIRQPDPSKQKEWDEIVQASSSSSKQSWADEVEAMQEVQKETINLEKLRHKQVVCYVLEAHPPFSILNGYVQHLWGEHGINKVHMLKNGIVLVRFDSIAGEDEAIQEEFTILTMNRLLLKHGMRIWSSQGRSSILSLYG